MAWTLGGVRIYVQDLTIGTKQTIARLQPLEGGTVKQLFGYETAIYKVTAKAVGENTRTLLENMSKDGSSNAFVSPEGSLGSFEVASFSAKRDNFISQSIDTNQNCNVPVYTVELELW